MCKGKGLYRKASKQMVCLYIHYTDKFREFSVATFSCEKSYRMNGTNNPGSCRNGKWDGKPPQCELVTCPEIPLSNNLILIHRHGSRIGKLLYGA